MELRLLFLLLGCFIAVDSYKILIFSAKFAYSHMNFMGHIADTLVNAGHEVVVLQPHMFPHKSSGTKKARVVEVPADPKVAAKFSGPNQDNLKMMWKIGSKSPNLVLGNMEMINTAFESILRETWKHDDVFEQLKNEKFDLAIAEMFEYVAFPIFHRLGIKNIVGAHSMTIFELTARLNGIPILPSFVPAVQGIANDGTSLWNRLQNLLFTWVSYRFSEVQLQMAQRVTNELYGNEQAPDIAKMVSEVSMIFSNSEPLLDFAKPTIHKVVDIGGIYVHKPNKVDKEWHEILSRRPKNVLMSFGTIAPSVNMDDHVKQSIISVMKKFKDVTFIWKYENPEDPIVKGVDNLIATKWSPQFDLIGDQRLNAFVTHGGFASIIETVTYGKPLLVVPIFGDQMRNAQMAAKHGFGIPFDKFDLGSPAVFEAALNKLLYDESYSNAAKKMAKILAARPFTPQEKLTKNIVLAAEFGNLKSYEPEGKHLNIVQYYNIDIFIGFVVILFGIVYTLKSIVRRMLASVTGVKVKVN